MRPRRRLGMELERREAVALRPSTVPSLSETWLISAPSPGSTAKPWFCAVTSTRFEPVTRTGWFAPRWPNGSLNVRRPSASATSWCPRQMPKSGARPSSSRDRLDGALELGRVAGAVADQHRRRLELEHLVGAPRAGDDDRLDAGLDEPAHDRALAAEIEHDDSRPGAERVRLAHAGLERGRRRGELRLREHPRPVEVRLRERAGVQLLGLRRAERAAHRAVLAQPPDERARVHLLERDDAAAARASPTTRAARGA